MAITEQVDTSACSHGVDQTWQNYAAPSSPTQQSSRSHVAAKKQTVMRFFSSKSTNIRDEASTPLTLQLVKVPMGDSPYVRAKQVQLVEKDPERAIGLFWEAINVGDRVDSALKDMAVVMKQQNRGEEAIQAILSFRHFCSSAAQESLDNVLLDLYKKCGRLDDQIDLLKHKLNLIHQGMVFNGKRTKTARSQGKKFQLSIREEATRLLGNLGWAYMQLCNYVAAEAVYRKALSIDADSNKLCNLGVCLLKQAKYVEARLVLEQVTPISPDGRLNSNSHLKSYGRSQALLRELSAAQNNELAPMDTNEQSLIATTPKEFDLWTHWKLWEPPSAPNLVPELNPVEISDDPADTITNPGLNQSTISNENDPAMQKLYLEVSGANKPDDSHPEMPNFGCKYADDMKLTPNFVCNYADDMKLTGTISPTTPPQRHDGSFKREVGPSCTVRKSKAKENKHDNRKTTISGGILCNHAADNQLVNSLVNALDGCWLNNGEVSPSMGCQKWPVARQLLLDMPMQGALQGTSVEDESMDDTASSCASGEGASSAVDSDLRLFACMMDTSFNGRAQDDILMDTTVLDFTCVDRVIESIVPDAPSASQHMENNANSAYAHALMNNAGYRHDDQFFALGSCKAGAHAQFDEESMESLAGIHQYRLRIFQENAAHETLQAVP